MLAHSCAVTDRSDFAVLWTRTYEEGRVPYTSLAHSPESFFQRPNITMVLNAIIWRARDGQPVIVP